MNERGVCASVQMSSVSPPLEATLSLAWAHQKLSQTCHGLAEISPSLAQNSPSLAQTSPSLAQI